MSSPHDHQQSAESLIALGFTRIEARVYIFLLRESPATGYRVAQALGVAAANIYKALDALEHKGAILVEPGPKRLCRAVPSRELLDRMERAYGERRRRAGELLAKVPLAEEDELLYSLKDGDQVFERCRAMLARATRIALFDISPGPLKVLLPEIEQALGRGVEVALRTEEEVTVPGAEVVVLPPFEQEKVSEWPGQWLNLVVDGQEHLLALLKKDLQGVHQAVYSGSPYLSWVYHSGVSSEIILDALIKAMSQVNSLPELQQKFREYKRIWATDAPGRQALLDRYKDS